MYRRPKVQFKPKIQSKATVAKIAVAKQPPLVKSRTSSASSVASTTSINNVAATTETQSSGPLLKTTITIVEDDSLSLPVHSQDVEEEQVIEFDNLEAVQLPNSEYNFLVPSQDSNSVANLSCESSQEVSTHSLIVSGSVELEESSPSLERRGSRITIKAKESPAALTVSDPSSFSEKKKTTLSVSPRKPKICLSSTRVKLPEDKSKVTMLDLLSYNPPMTEQQKERRRKADEEAEAASTILSLSPKKSDSHKKTSIYSDKTTASKKSDNKKSSQGPRVKYVDGKIVLDEESLILTTNKAEPVGEVVYEGKEEAEHGANYASFRTKGLPGKKYRWSVEETVEFYRALSAVGTDFSLMSRLFFPGLRTRLDLRNKFKKEEKLNNALIDKTLRQTDLSVLREVLDKRKEEKQVEILQEDQEVEAIQETSDDAITESSQDESRQPKSPSNVKKRGSKRKQTNDDEDYSGRKDTATSPIRKSTRTVRAPVRLS